MKNTIYNIFIFLLLTATALLIIFGSNFWQVLVIPAVLTYLALGLIIFSPYRPEPPADAHFFAAGTMDPTGADTETCQPLNNPKKTSYE